MLLIRLNFFVHKSGDEIYGFFSAPYTTPLTNNIRCRDLLFGELPREKKTPPAQAKTFVCTAHYYSSNKSSMGAYTEEMI